MSDTNKLTIEEVENEILPSLRDEGNISAVRALEQLAEVMRENERLRSEILRYLAQKVPRNEKFAVFDITGKLVNQHKDSEDIVTCSKPQGFSGEMTAEQMRETFPTKTSGVKNGDS